MNRASGFTLTEVLIATGIFSLLGMTVLMFTRYVNSSFLANNWKQNADSAIKLNNLFWEKYFALASNKISEIKTDGKGVITAAPTVFAEPLKIKGGRPGSSGTNLLAGYPGGTGAWDVWTFSGNIKQPWGNTFQHVTVTGYLSGTRPNISLFGKVASGSKIITEQKLLENIDSIQATSFPFAEENAEVLILRFVLKNPNSAMKVEGETNAKLNTDIQAL